MSNTERQKGLRGEREVAALYTAAGFEVRGLEATGDHLVVCGRNSTVVLHSEVKRQELARPWQWWEQATRETPEHAVTAVHFRRSRSPWLVMLAAADLVTILQQLDDSQAALRRAYDTVDQLSSTVQRLERETPDS